jgi:hypothetical protein
VRLSKRTITPSVHGVLTLLSIHPSLADKSLEQWIDARWKMVNLLKAQLMMHGIVVNLIACLLCSRQRKTLKYWSYTTV